MEVEALERSEYHICGPSHCLHRVGGRHGEYVVGVIRIGKLHVALIVGLLYI